MSTSTCFTGNMAGVWHIAMLKPAGETSLVPGAHSLVPPHLQQPLPDSRSTLNKMDKYLMNLAQVIYIHCVNSPIMYIVQTLVLQKLSLPVWHNSRQKGFPDDADNSIFEWRRLGFSLAASTVVHTLLISCNAVFGISFYVGLLFLTLATVLCWANTVDCCHHMLPFNLFSFFDMPLLRPPNSTSLRCSTSVRNTSILHSTNFAFFLEVDISIFASMIVQQSLLIKIRTFLNYLASFMDDCVITLGWVWCSCMHTQFNAGWEF